MNKFTFAFLTLATLAFTGCTPATVDTVEKPTTPVRVAPAATAEETDSVSDSAPSAESPVEDSTPPVRKDAAEMTDAEKRASNLATDEDIKAITAAYTAYEFYEQSLQLVENGTGFVPEKKLTQDELATFSSEMCTAIEENDGQMDLATLANFGQTTSIEQMKQLNEHVGGGMVVAVYYDCPQYTDTLHNFLLRFQNN